MKNEENEKAEWTDAEVVAFVWIDHWCNSERKADNMFQFLEQYEIVKKAIERVSKASTLKEMHRFVEKKFIEIFPYDENEDSRYESHGNDSAIAIAYNRKRARFVEALDEALADKEGVSLDV